MNIVTSIVKLRCPRCRKGHMFQKPFELSKPLAMPERCEVCGQRMEPEPGFYFGAMFLSYIISGWALLLISLSLVFYFKWSVGVAMGVVLLVAALSYVKLLRFSRSLWMHLMVKYEPHHSAQE